MPRSDKGKDVALYKIRAYLTDEGIVKDRKKMSLVDKWGNGRRVFQRV